MPLRKKVIAAPYSAANERNRGNRPVSRLAAPSQEKTTNWGGVWPGSRGVGTGWCGWSPVSAVDPSPMSRKAGWLLGSVGRGGTGGVEVAGAADPCESAKEAQPAAASSAVDAPPRKARRDSPLIRP